MQCLLAAMIHSLLSSVGKKLQVIFEFFWFNITKSLFALLIILKSFNNDDYRLK